MTAPPEMEEWVYEHEPRPRNPLTAILKLFAVLAVIGIAAAGIVYLAPRLAESVAGENTSGTVAAGTLVELTVPQGATASCDGQLNPVQGADRVGEAVQMGSAAGEDSAIRDPPRACQRQVRWGVACFDAAGDRACLHCASCTGSRGSASVVWLSLRRLPLARWDRIELMRR